MDVVKGPQTLTQPFERQNLKTNGHSYSQSVHSCALIFIIHEMGSVVMREERPPDSHSAVPSL